jgi:hypothetical protein
VSTQIRPSTPPEGGEFRFPIYNEEVRSAASVIQNQLHLLEEIAGSERFEQALSHLPDDYREELAALTSVGWCRLAAANTLIRSVAFELGRDPVELADTITQRSLIRNFRTVWRVMLRFTTDEALMQRTSLIYEKTSDQGKLRATLPRPGRADLEFECWPNVDPIDLSGLAVGIRTVLEIAGRKHVKVSYSGYAPRLYYRAAWKPRGPFSSFASPGRDSQPPEKKPNS